MVGGYRFRAVSAPPQAKVASDTEKHVHYNNLAVVKTLQFSSSATLCHTLQFKIQNNANIIKKYPTISYRVNNETKRGSWVWNFVRENLGPVAAMMIHYVQSHLLGIVDRGHVCLLRNPVGWQNDSTVGREWKPHQCGKNSTRVLPSLP
jgi:hypothetical protein